MPYFAQIGRDRRFTDENIRWIRGAVEEAAIERIGRHQAAKGNGGSVYFIEIGDYVKIGYTRAPASRAKRMLTDSPVEPKLLHSEPGTFKTEKMLHRRFTHLRVRGEWFRKEAGLLEYIEQRWRFT